MHPDDVAVYVRKSVTELEEQLRGRDDLGVSSVRLLDDETLLINFTKTQWAAAGVRRTYTDPYTHQTSEHVDPTIDLSRHRRLDLVLSMNLARYDFDPPTAELVRPDLTPLPVSEWPKTLGQRGIVDEHPDYSRPFFCRRGFREYHTHFQHEDDPWDKHREGLALHSLVIELLDDLRTRWML